jgi:hypothetical protein
VGVKQQTRIGFRWKNRKMKAKASNAIEDNRIFLVHTMPRRSNQLAMTIKTLEELKAARRPSNLQEWIQYSWHNFKLACEELVATR